MNYHHHLLNPIIQESICSNFNFEEAVQFRESLSLPSLDHPITIFDPFTNRPIILDGVNSKTITIYKSIQKYGLDQTFLRACVFNEILEVKMLLQYSPDLNQKSSSGHTPLMLAALYNAIELTELLLTAGADINECSFAGSTALELALSFDRTEIVQLLRNSQK